MLKFKKDNIFSAKFEFAFEQIPSSIKGFSFYDVITDFYTIILNCKYSYKSIKSTLFHEINHILNDDFSDYQEVGLLEVARH